MTDEPRVIVCDLGVDGWTVKEARVYRAAVGVNAEYAIGAMQKAAIDSRHEAREAFGDAVDKPGWDPPDGWMPLAMLNLDPFYLAGFAFIAARRTVPGLDFGAFTDEIHVGELSRAFYAELMAEAEDAAPPLVNREQRRAKSGRPTKTATPSRTSSAGRSTRSTP
jgi:hypothetical protein